MMMNRRTLLSSVVSMACMPLIPSSGHAAVEAMHVLKDPNCGCCSAWIDMLESAGFRVTTEPSMGTALSRYKLENGIPMSMVSCHTGKIDGYMIEGHVPAADIRRLLIERPEAVGLAVPGMPYGSPGMGSESEREAYEVHLIRRDGTTATFSSYDAA
ncbi:DUF411 domain-containing protein [Maritimibacter sp. 55A14]|uniref:DUF411 domain-containing protein n=1 Tax=Maritimibacter sp. 55A14 TaxID=2174844 RepID=UPI0018EE98E6|nr:DUF411 domain-containing protein [Maritimibacter sp. 55A14]